MRKYIDPEASGQEKGATPVYKKRDEVDNCYCPRDGHYCEQPNCENCMAEA